MAVNIIHPTQDAFSYTGHINPALIDGTLRLNSKYAWLNCPVVAVRTAHLLEMGQPAILSIWLQNIPRFYNMVSIDYPLYANLHDLQRMCIRFEGKKDELEFCLREIGPHSHAIIFAVCHNKIGGHCWNYVNNNGLFITLDNYSKSKHQLGIQNPDKFWLKYKPQFHALIFGKLTPSLMDVYPVVSS
jgi:hypothetical protein